MYDPWVELNYEHTNLIDVGEGPHEIVFLHGWCCRTGDFAKQVHALSDNCRVVAIDWQRRIQEAGDACSAEAASELIASVVQERGLKRPILVGHSMGAFLTTCLAKWKMVPYVGLIPVDTALPRPDFVRDRYIELCAKLRKGPYEPICREFVTKTFFKPEELGKESDSIIKGLVSARHDIAIGLLEQLSEADAGPSLSTIDKPMHVVDSGVGVYDLEGLHEFVPHATGEQLEGTGHFITIYHADRVTSIIRSFIDAL